MTRTPAALLAALLLTAPLLAACSGDGSSASDGVGSDPTADPAAEAPARPTASPAADGPVRSTGLITVMDTGDGPEACFGAVAESYPPQCGGPAITGWDWTKGVIPHGVFERQGATRWGMFAVEGTWDGEVFGATSAIPAALYDPMMTEPEVLPDPSVVLEEDELAAAQEDVGSLPGAAGAYVAESAGGQPVVVVDVVHDDGSLQAWADAAYGEGVVRVVSALVPLG